MSAALGNPRRRAHKKSKLGCLTCKQRHVRCDELWPACQNCLKLNLMCRHAEGRKPPRHVLQGLPVTARIPALSSHPAIVSVRPEPWTVAGHSISPLAVSVAAHGLPSEWSKTDSSLMYGFVQLCTKMQHEDGHMLSLGGSGLPMLLECAFHYDFARYTLLNFLTMHLAHLQKSSQLHLLTQFYRVRAFATLGQAINEFSDANADAILATAIMLVYTSAGEREHKHLENGVAAVISAMQPIKHTSKFPQYFRGPYSLVRPLQGQPDEPVRLPKAQKLSPDVSHVLLHSLQQLKALFNGYPAFMEAVQNLWFVIYNVSGKSKMSMRQQYHIHDSLRALKSIGVDVLADFGRATPTEMLFMAYQELVEFVGLELRPDVSSAYFILAKTDVVVRIHDRLLDKLAQGAKCVSPSLYVSIMEVPYKIAITYQKSGRIALD